MPNCKQCWRKRRRSSTLHSSKYRYAWDVMIQGCCWACLCDGVCSSCFSTITVAVSQLIILPLCRDHVHGACTCACIDACLQICTCTHMHAYAYITHALSLSLSLSLSLTHTHTTQHTHTHLHNANAAPTLSLALGRRWRWSWKPRQSCCEHQRLPKPVSGWTWKTTSPPCRPLQIRHRLN